MRMMFLVIQIKDESSTNRELRESVNTSRDKGHNMADRTKDLTSSSKEDLVEGNNNFISILAANNSSISSSPLLIFLEVRTSHS